jgi:hypothetical protein
MLDYWLIPALLVLMAVLWALYLLIKHKGGTGVRTDGRTLVDKPDDENPPLE